MLSSPLPPAQVFQEMHRCLKPGGTAIMSFSNRCFPTKGEPRAQLRPLPQMQQLSVHCMLSSAACRAAVRCQAACTCTCQAARTVCQSLPQQPADAPHAPVCAAAIALWTSTGDADHVWIVGSYFHYSVPGGFTEPQAKDISPRAGTDPMYVVYASKKA